MKETQDLTTMPKVVDDCNGTEVAPIEGAKPCEENGPCEGYKPGNDESMSSESIEEEYDDGVEDETGEVGSLGENDLVIAIMGVTGSGKSTFISLLADQSLEIGHSLNSCTVHVGVYSFSLGDQTVYLIDTPGFDDTSRPDSEILKDIAFFFAAIYKRRVRLAGIVYLHRITDTRMPGSSIKNLHILQKICGDRGMASVVLATTMWQVLDKDRERGIDIGDRRERELQQPEFWGVMIDRGSRMARHDGSFESARRIIDSLVKPIQSSDPSPPGGACVLDIQEEMVDQEKNLDETAAGQFVQSGMLEARRRFETELAEYKESMELALQEKDVETFELLRREKEKAETLIAQRDADSQKLNVSLEQLAREKDAQYEALANAFEEKQRQRQGETADGTAAVSRLQHELSTVTSQLQSMHRRLEGAQGEQDRARERELHLLQRQAELEDKIALEVRRGQSNPVVVFYRSLMTLVTGHETEDDPHIAHGASNSTTRRHRGRVNGEKQSSRRKESHHRRRLHRSRQDEQQYLMDHHW
ncbi:P-loop containing nucleoside triphosphate hydrolase protein [Emericellopsis atlantica]|uniref:P-loop containing nucleoside triphosphate hydrolase protein n=1 Tax=Emericellopsis atlantica TaxID=2614577 RepID=A0A9P8CNQ1_9HYPO|nr:P-loop containing nucleoside triphosphate hydrolase protein [Emericellopsis atlantica]KAG9251956.1 P-loop containing nucleoside triphosphate hydrolase protein [Emericellopsis atlantica]